MTPQQANNLLALFPETPRRHGLDMLEKWASFIPRHFRDDWQPLIADVSRREGLRMTPQACAHFDAFAHSPPAARPADFDDRVLSFIDDLSTVWFGDPNMLGTFAAVCAHGSILVGEVAVRTVRVLAAGPTTRGWTARLAFPGDRVLMVLGADHPILHRHELAHLWCDFALSEPPLPDLSAIAVARARFVCETRRLPSDVALLERLDEAERRAVLLAAAWALPYFSDDPDEA